MRLNAHREPIPLPPPEPGAVLADVSASGSALAWFTAEPPVLLAVIDQAARTGFDEHAWRLGWTLEYFGWMHAKLGDSANALGYCERAVAQQQRIGDRFGAAETWDSLGYVHRLLGDHAQSTACYQQAIELYRSLDDRYNEADTLASLGDAHLAGGDPEAARSAWERALPCSRTSATRRHRTSEPGSRP